MVVRTTHREVWSGVAEDELRIPICTHCGCTDTTRLGLCRVCHQPVCECCGNSQFTQGERKVIHNSCLTQSNDSFTMIKFNAE